MTRALPLFRGLAWCCLSMVTACGPPDPPPHPVPTDTPDARPL